MLLRFLSCVEVNFNPTIFFEQTYTFLDATGKKPCCIHGYITLKSCGPHWDEATSVPSANLAWLSSAWTMDGKATKAQLAQLVWEFSFVNATSYREQRINFETACLFCAANTFVTCVQKIVIFFLKSRVNTWSECWLLYVALFSVWVIWASRQAWQAQAQCSWGNLDFPVSTFQATCRYLQSIAQV